MKISGVHILIIFLFAAKVSFAASHPADTLTPLTFYKHFGEEDGLHCKTVYEAIQDRDGFMWFSTDGGVFRFDGKVFKQYNIENGVTDKEVLKIFQDSYGRIWFLTLNGYLSFWKQGKIYNPSNTAFLKKAYTGGSIYSYFEDSRKRIWLGTSSFTYIVIHGDSVGIIKSRMPPSVDAPSFHVHEDAEGNIWTVSRFGLYVLSGRKIEGTLRLRDEVFWLYHGSKKTEAFIWSLEGSLSRVSDKTVSIYADKGEIPSDNKVVNVVADGNAVWFCTAGNGIFKFVNGKIVRYLEKALVLSVFRDRENNLWFTTGGGQGIYMLPSGSDLVKNYSQENGLSANEILSVVAGPHDEIWLGHNDGTVEKIQNNKAAILNLNTSDDPGFNRVTSLAVYSDIVFCGTDIGAFFIRNNKSQFIPVELTRDEMKSPIKQLYISENKNIYAGHTGGFFEIAKNKDGYLARHLYRHLYNSTEKDNLPIRTFAITEYPRNHLLVATTTGLAEFIRGKGLVKYKTDVDFSLIRILDMKQAPVNLLAIGTNGNGIYFLNGEKIYQHVSTSNGLSDDNCKRIFVSGNTLYAATDKGLNVLEKIENAWSVSAVMTAKNGLLSNTVNDVAVSNGTIYVATEKGLSVFDKTVLSRQKFIAKARVIEMVTDSSYSVADTLYNFRADIPRLLIRFAYPVFNPGNELKVTYRLLHGETDNAKWTRSGNNEVEFSSLSPGSYIFQLKPDAPSVSDAGITNLYINIIPLWWQTTAARIGFALLAVGLIFFIVKRRIQLQYKKRLQQLTMLESERSRIASDMHDDIGADLTQISIWSSILDASENKDKNVLSRITKSSNEVLQKMEQIIWALNSFNNHTTDLISYLHEYALQYLESADMNLFFEASESMPVFEISAIQKRNVFLTVKELLHNTVKHSGAKNVSIKIYSEGSVLNIEYKDDGKGFTHQENGDGLGHITVQKRMKEIDSIISVQSSPGKGFNAHLKINLTADKKGIKKLPDTFASGHD